MRFRMALFILVVSGAFGCNTVGEPVEFSKACGIENEKKVIEVSGFLAERGSVFCSSTGGRLECGFDLLELQGSDKKLRVEIEQGSGANTVDKLERGYKKEDIRIRDNSGNVLNLATDKVKVTGKMSIAEPKGEAQGICFMQVTKIEK